MSRLEQSPHMVRKTEDGRFPPGLIAANSLENTQSIMQGVGQDMDGGFFPINKFSIHPNLFHLFRHKGFSASQEIFRTLQYQLLISIVN